MSISILFHPTSVLTVMHQVWISVEKDFITCIAVDMLKCSLQAITWEHITKLHEVQKENHLLAEPKVSARVKSQGVDLRLLSYKLELEVSC